MKGLIISMELIQSNLTKDLKDFHVTWPEKFERFDIDIFVISQVLAGIGKQATLIFLLYFQRMRTERSKKNFPVRFSSRVQHRLQKPTDSDECCPYFITASSRQKYSATISTTEKSVRRYK